MDTCDIVLSFGKHKGHRLGELELSYLRYLASQSDFRADPAIPGHAQVYLKQIGKWEAPIKEIVQKAPTLVAKCIKCRKKAGADVGYVFRLCHLTQRRFIYLHTQCFEELEQPIK